MHTRDVHVIHDIDMHGRLIKFIKMKKSTLFESVNSFLAPARDFFLPVEYLNLITAIELPLRQLLLKNG